MSARSALPAWKKVGAELHTFIARTLEEYSRTDSLMPDLRRRFSDQGMKLRVKDARWKLSQQDFTLRGLGQVPYDPAASLRGRIGEILRRAKDGEDDALAEVRTSAASLEELQFVCSFELLWSAPQTADKLKLNIVSRDTHFSIAQMYVHGAAEGPSSPQLQDYSPYIGGLDYTLQLRLTSYLSDALLTAQLLWDIHLLAYQVALDEKIRMLEKLGRILKSTA